MTALTDLQAQLAAARANHQAAGDALVARREQAKQVDRALAGARRRGDRQGVARLERQASGIAAQVTAQREALGGVRAELDGLLGRLTELADPTKQIEELSDRIPILMFPVRLETRFRVAGRNQSELWVRIYPDDCQIDGFEPLLSESEAANVTAFWIAMWRAGRVEAQRRGAWRSLVGGAGSGRAAYAISQLAPSNPGDEPDKTARPDDVVLVIVPGIDPTAAETTAAFAYWISVWQADGDASKQALAYAKLSGDVAGDARADELIAGFAPDPNGWDPPKPKQRLDVQARCAVLKLPVPPQTTTGSWTRPPRAAALPDRFVALLYQGGSEVKRAIGGPIPAELAVAPDPSLAPGDQITVTDDDLQLNDELRWLADFDQAVASGMGLKIPLTATEAQRGFDRLVVVGLRISADAEQGKQTLEQLIGHQLASKAGYGLVPQGSPTNNTDSAAAAYSWVDDADASYDRVIGGREAYVESDDPLERRDGQWLAEALGIDDAVLAQVPNAAGADQLEARAMNIALWNGTMGYGLEEMFTPVVGRADIAATRLFFTRFVSGRGPLPAVRVGKQPYGLLPAMAFSRYRSAGRARPGGDRVLAAAGGDYLQRLHTLLLRMEGDWHKLAAGVATVGQPGDAHQTLLDIVGLHPGSVEYHQRYAESLDQLYNKLSMQDGWLLGGLIAAWLADRGKTLLAQLGADPDARPPILEKFFYGDSPLLSGPVVDDAPLSEQKPIRAYTADQKNYIQWLATTSLDKIRQQDFGGKPEPTALLYLMLRHAMMLGHWDAGLRFLEARALIDPVQARLEPAFLQMQSAGGAFAAGKSKLEPLLAPQPAVTGDATTTLADYVLRPAVLQAAPETEDLREIVAALGHLATTPTARLERVFAEHVDSVTYRLDAWKTGLAATRLAELRAASADDAANPIGGARGRTTGIYLGAFGWLENLRPRTTNPQPVTLEGELAKTFQRGNAKDAPLTQDPKNAGYIHAPSLNHAATAAILKNAYRVNASPANPDAMAVNLSSTRVRQALAVLEGVRNGQTLGALLGYRFERGLHDEHGLAEVDKFIYPLRQAFPLAANQLRSTATDGTVDITLIEARNVIDGQKLVDRVRASGQKRYPFGLPTGTAAGQLLPVSSPAEQQAIDTEVDRLLDLADALGDLLLAESVYQVVLGNFDRAAANTTAIQQGAHPPETQVVNTPRAGIALVHRVALHLDPSADPATSPSAVPMTPRAAAEAPLNLWLAGRFPDPGDVAVQVTYRTPALAAPRTITITQEQLALQPIDLLYLGELELEQQMAELDDRITQLVRYGGDAHPDLAIEIQYTQPAGRVSLFELAALVRSLRLVVLKNRPIRPTDMVMPLDAKQAEGTWDDAELGVRVTAAIAALAQRRDALVALKTDPAPLDEYVGKVSTELLATARHGVPQTGIGQLHGDVRAIYDAVVAKLRAIADAWTRRAGDYATLMAGYGALGSDPERIEMLKTAELLVAASLTTSPGGAAAYKAIVDGEQAALTTDLVQVTAALAWTGTRLADFMTMAAALAPAVAAHDPVALDLAPQQAAMARLRDTIAARVTGLADDVTRRVSDATAAVAAVAALSSGDDRVAALLAAAKRVLGDEIVLIPHFQLAVERGAEVTSCVGGSAALLTDLVAGGRRFPVDDWLYGVARVRAPLAAWENAAVLAEAFGADPADLTPLQLPFVAGDRWTALEFDTAAATANDRLLYTAHFAVPFDASADQCGLLVDEWPELVPAKDVMSGVTFHYDRPDSQPPQMMVLALPAVVRGSWSWDDLVATLTETLDGARLRAVEPGQVDASPYAQLLPSTVMAVTLHWITIATNLALNNRIYDLIGGA